MAKNKQSTAVKDFFDAVLGEDREYGWRWNIFKICVLCLCIAGTQRACAEIETSSSNNNSSQSSNITLTMR